jgi:hypothetical protein
MATIICEYCSQEHESGLLNWMEHLNTCPHNCPSENIEHHKEIVQIEFPQRKADEEQHWFDRNIFIHMTEKERNELLCRSMMGILTQTDRGWTCMMGSESIKRYEDYIDQMKRKYCSNLNDLPKSDPKIHLPQKYSNEAHLARDSYFPLT